MKNSLVVSFFFLLGCGPIVPEGDVQRPSTFFCQIDPVRDALLEAESVSERHAILSDFFNECGETLSRGAGDPIDLLLHDSRLDYDYRTTRWFQEIEVGESRRAFNVGQLGLQPGPGKRPLVLLDCGLQCDVDGPSMRQLLMLLFDEGDFHVLALPSSSSKSYLKRNGRFAIGGLEEGRAFVKVANYMRYRSPWRDRISSVHVFGISLGGHASLYAALYASHMNLDRAAIESFAAGCPVVDLERSVRRLYRPTLVGKFALKKFKSQIRGVLSSNPILQMVLGDRKRITYDDAIDITAEASALYYLNEGNHWFKRTPPFDGEEIKDHEDFWSYSRFQDFAELVDQNVFIWAAANDVVVHVSDNTEILRDVVERRKQNFKFLVTEKGGHCNFAKTFGWRTAGEIMRTHILVHSPKLLESRRERVIPINYGDYFRLRGYEKIRSVRWYVREGFHSAVLTTTLSSGRRFEMIFDFDRLGIQIEGPVSEVEAQALTRRLNTNYRLQDPSGLLHEKTLPDRIKWYEYL